MKTICLLLTALLIHTTLSAAPAFSSTPKVTRLFTGSNIDQWTLNHPGGWTVENESLSPASEYRKNNYLWSVQKYKDFILTLQYKLSAGANSGVFIRANPDDPVKDGIEIQLLDGTREQAKDGQLDKRANGAIYSIVAPSEYNNHPAGEWNALLIYARGSQLAVYINGNPVASADLSKWTEGGVNPDGTSNKIRDPLSTFSKPGNIGLQYHGKPVWFRDISVTQLEAHSPDITKVSARTPKNDDDLRYWLTNMVTYHNFSDQEVALATGLSKSEISAALKRFRITNDPKSPRRPNEPLTTVPYPGGRHPRIGFLDGAFDPQRETKLSIFTPWDPNSYVVVDLPEAIFSNLGLTYLAHTHVPTIWNTTGTELAPLEWQRNFDGSYEITRTLPNHIAYTSKAVPTDEAVYFRITLHNGTTEKLSELRLQNCVMLRGAPEFAELTTNNRLLDRPYATVHNPEKNRWVITAWEPHLRFSGNRQCPCLHSDPKLPDCSPGETVSVDGILTFYEGTDIKSELARIDKTDWRSQLD